MQIKVDGDLCDAFRRNADGSWTSTRPVTIEGAGGEKLVVAGALTISPGVTFFGVSLAAWLEERCGDGRRQSE